MKRFLWHLLEFQLAMMLGALVCYLLGRVVPASSRLAAVYHPGTYLFAAGDVFFLTLPVVAWMIFRNQGWQRSMELTGAMLVPVATIVLLGELTAVAYLLWLVTAMYPAMSLGMLVYMLYRRDHYSGRKYHEAPTPIGKGEGQWLIFIKKETKERP